MIKYYIKKLIRIILIVSLLLSTQVSFTQPVEIIFWHSLAGKPGLEVKNLVSKFNNSQDKFYIKTIYKGSYLDSLTSFAAAFRADKPPDIIQVYEVGSHIMLNPVGVTKPINDILPLNEFENLISNLYPEILNYYSHNSILEAMPFNVSIPIVFYNNDLLNTLGFTKFPETFTELEILLQKISQKGYKCGFTTAYPAWITIEAFSKAHGLPLIDQQQNIVLFNNPLILSHIKRLYEWQQKKYFVYGGRVDDATSLFTSNICPIFTQSSGAYHSLKQTAKFKVGVAALPREHNVLRNQHSNIIGGAAIWIIAGKSQSIYEGIAQFLKFLITPEIQQLWHENTGYLPLGNMNTFGPKIENHEIRALASQELNTSNTPDSSYKMLSPIREIIDEALEAVFAGIKTPEQALKDAELRANHILKRFKRNTQKSL